MSRERKKRLYHLVLWVVSVAWFLPVLWIFTAALKTKSELLTIPPKWIFEPTLANITGLFARENFLTALFNSFFISVSSVLLAILISFLAAYCFSRFEPKGTDLMMFLLLSIRMVPAAAVVLPVFLMYTVFGWKNTYFGMIGFYAMFSIPFSVWILKGFIDSVSPLHDETALVNGGSRLHVIFKVILPQVVPGLIAAFVFNLIFVWNEFLFNFIIGGSKTTMIPVILSSGMYSPGGGIDWTFVAALTSVYILPPIVAIYFFQRYLLVGMTFGTVRGEV